MNGNSLICFELNATTRAEAEGMSLTFYVFGHKPKYCSMSMMVLHVKSPKALCCILWEPWISVQTEMVTHPKVVGILEQRACRLTNKVEAL